MNWGVLGQVATMWVIVAVIAAPLVGRYLRARRVRAELYARLLEEQRTRAERLRASLYVADSQLERQRLSREAATPLTESQWQANARKAEGLGFRDEIEPKRAS